MMEFLYGRRQQQHRRRNGSATSTTKKARNKPLFALHCVAVLSIVVWFEMKMFAAVHDAKKERVISISEDSTINKAENNNKAVADVVVEPPNLRENTEKEPIKSRESSENKPKPIQKKASVDVKKPPPPTYTKEDFLNCTLLAPNDAVYAYGAWDGSPIVVESHKLVFFTVPKVGCTVWKQLFRRMAGYMDWSVDLHPLPHAPKRNGLTYLYDYPPQQAEAILTDPSWTRAMFVRDPKERLLSAYLDKGMQNQYVQYHCCPSSSSSSRNNKETRAMLYEKLHCAHPQKHGGPTASQADKQAHTTKPLVSFLEFLTLLVPACDDPHWNAQAHRIDAKYWPYINFVGRMDTLADDARRLLERVDAWNDYGANGWPHGAIFASGSSGAGATVSHATDSASKLNEYFNNEAIEMAVRQLVQQDFERIPILNLTKEQQQNSNTILQEKIR